jgi:hypothetical protein
MSDVPAVRLLGYFGAIDNPRMERTRHHPLLDIVAIAICAMICGSESWVEVETFGKAKRAWLGTVLALPNGIPSHDTVGRVFAVLDLEQFEAGFRSWAATVVHLTAGGVVAVDGKQLRRSRDATSGKAALTLVGAWAGTSRLTLG